MLTIQNLIDHLQSIWSPDGGASCTLVKRGNTRSVWLPDSGERAQSQTLSRLQVPPSPESANRSAALFASRSA